MAPTQPTPTQAGHADDGLLRDPNGQVIRDADGQPVRDTGDGSTGSTGGSHRA